MRILYNKTIAVATLIFLIAVAMVQISQVYATKTTAVDMFQSFLTGVVGLDLTKYTIEGNGPAGVVYDYGYGVSYPSTYGGSIQEEEVSCTLVSSQSEATAWCLIDNGTITSCSFSPIRGSPIFAHEISSNVVEAAKIVLQRYQAYAVQHNVVNADMTYLQQALAFLNLANNQTITEKTAENMKFQMSPDPAYTSIVWTYTKNGVDMQRKGIALSFRNGSNFNDFADTWTLYSTGASSVISEAEAVSVGLAFAKNYSVTLAHFNGDGSATAAKVEPDWSNMTYDAVLNMLPGASLNSSVPTVPGGPSIPSTVVPSKTARDPTTLYPMWQLIFYFTKPVGGVVGLQVGVWGDTGEVAYCNEYGYLGASGPTVTSPQSNGAFQLQPAYAYAILFAAATAVVMGSYLIIRKRKKH
jgi:hypothetical protein